MLKTAPFTRPPPSSQNRRNRSRFRELRIGTRNAVRNGRSDGRAIDHVAAKSTWLFFLALLGAQFRFINLIREQWAAVTTELDIQ